MKNVISAREFLLGQECQQGNAKLSERRCAVIDIFYCNGGKLALKQISHHARTGIEGGHALFTLNFKIA